MKNRWRIPIVLFFRPETAGSASRYEPIRAPVVRPNGRRWQVSVKALVWMIVSLLIALAIGQLH